MEWRPLQCSSTLPPLLYPTVCVLPRQPHLTGTIGVKFSFHAWGMKPSSSHVLLKELKEQIGARDARREADLFPLTPDSSIVKRPSRHCNWVPLPRGKKHCTSRQNDQIPLNVILTLVSLLRLLSSARSTSAILSLLSTTVTTQPQCIFRVYD